MLRGKRSERLIKELVGILEGADVIEDPAAQSREHYLEGDRYIQISTPLVFHMLAILKTLRG